MFNNSHDIILFLLLLIVSQLFASVRSSSGQRTVIIAAAYGYNFMQFKSFLGPLRKVYDGDIVMFVDDNLDTDVWEMLQGYVVQTYPLDKGSRLGVKGDRYLGYAKICGGYDICFATDVRDVFVQANPFKHLHDNMPTYVPDLVLSEEHNDHTIASRRANRGWILSCWGEDVLHQFSDYPIICSGTIMGTPKGFKALHEALFNAIDDTSRIKGCLSRDQGHLNYIYRMNLLHEYNITILVQPRGYGIVNTLGIVNKTDIQDYFNDDGFVINDDNTISPVVHQLDRHPKPNKLLRAKLIRESVLSGEKLKEYNHNVRVYRKYSAE